MRFDINRLAVLSGLGSDSQGLNEASNRSYHDGDANDEADYRFGKNQLSEMDGADESPASALAHLFEDGLLEDEDYETHKGEKDDDGDEAFRGDKKGDKEGVNEDEDYTTKKTSKRKKGGGKPFWGDKKGDKEGPDEGLELEEYGLDTLSSSHPGGAGEMADPELDFGEADDPILELDENAIRRELHNLRAQRLQESKLRVAIRNEIEDIFESLGLSDSSWVYGDNQPKNSKDGQVATAFPGIGFM
jgi:hypothetical protein